MVDANLTGATNLSDQGATIDWSDTFTDAVGLTDRLDVTGPPTLYPITAAGSLTLAMAASAADTTGISVSCVVLPNSRAVRFTVAGLYGEEVTVTRLDGNTLPAVPVRYSVIADTTETLVGVDYEAPMDVTLRYVATVDLVEYVSAPVVIASNDQDWYTSLGQPTLSRVVLIEKFQQTLRRLAHSRVRPLSASNPLIITNARQGAEAELTFLTLDYADAQSMRAVLAASPLFALKCPPDRGLPGGVMYLLAADYTEERITNSARDPERRFIVSVVEVDRPPLVVPPPTENTWQDWYDEALGNSSWAAWATKTWLDLLTEEL